MELTKAHADLDSYLPGRLRATAEILAGGSPSEASGTSDVTSDPTEDSIMAGTNIAAPILTPEAVREAATAEVKRLFEQKDNESAVASTIEKYVTSANQANAEVVAVQVKLTAAEQKLAAVEAELAEAKKKFPVGEPNNTKDADKDAKENKGKPEKGQASDDVAQATASLKAELEELKQALAAEKDKGKKKAAFMEKAKARKTKMDDKKVKSKKFADKAMASTDDGDAVMSDADFDATLEMLAEEVPAEETQAVADGNPVAAPKDGDGPAGKQKHPSLVGKGKEGGTPVAAPTDASGPAQNQKHPKMAHASEGEATTDQTTDQTTEQATAAAVPAAPDLSGAQIMEQATAALMSGGPVPTAQGKSAYAKHFGI